MQRVVKRLDAFEQLICELLWSEGYWVRQSVKVELTKEEKRKIGRASAPRWEIDVVAYSGRDNEILAVECKSYLDSGGVTLASFDGASRGYERYKLFNDTVLREVVLSRLLEQLASCGACPPDAKVKLCLACGRIRNDSDRKGLHRHFEEQGWKLWDEPWLKERLEHIAAQGYENQVSSVVAKLLLRGRV